MHMIRQDRVLALVICIMRVESVRACLQYVCMYALTRLESPKESIFSQPAQHAAQDQGGSKLSTKRAAGGNVVV